MDHTHPCLSLEIYQMLGVEEHFPRLDCEALFRLWLAARETRAG